ncbi:MAG TPA: hypothetical protein VFR58_12620 [Flavisolibacter sp.]|nr:hypothetical protein [Flavisolibacter sp.]
MLDNDIITKEEKEIFDDVLDNIRSRFTYDEDSGPAVPFIKYALLQDYSGIIPYKTVKVQSPGGVCCLSLVKVQYSYTSGKHGTGIGSYLQAYVFIELPKAFGHTIIKRETIMNKIMELFQPLEIDFEDDRDFSREFYVLAKDKDKARELMTRRFRDAVREIKGADPYIECLNDYMLVTNKRGVADDSLNSLIGFGIRISSLAPF